MAKQTEVRLVDDLDGSTGDETVEFALSGKSYEIDLSMFNANRLRDSLAEFVASARRVSGGGSRPARRTAPSSTDRAFNRAVREWAVQQGMKIAERGRIAADVLEAYERAH